MTKQKRAELETVLKQAQRERQPTVTIATKDLLGLLDALDIANHQLYLATYRDDMRL